MVKREVKVSVEKQNDGFIINNEPYASNISPQPQNSTAMSDQEIIEMLRRTIELQQYRIDALSNQLDQIKHKEVLEKNM
jgi:hypothetical protein